MSEAAIAVCQTCGMPVRVIFDDEGEVERVLAVCGHPSLPAQGGPKRERKYGSQGSGTKTTFGGGDAYDG